MIAVFDSGEGGLSVLREITRILPDEKYIYYSDNANCPYGDKTADFIIGRCRSIADHLIIKGADIIVVACNTATAAAIATLRAEYSDASSGEVRRRVSTLSGGRRNYVHFIGMEPAVKPAALGTRTGTIGVLATAGTLKGSKYLNTKDSVNDNIKIVEHVGRGFVELVENGELTGAHARSVVEASLRPLLEAGADTIVLGCTHYPFLLETMREVAGAEVRFIDPAPAVARQLVRIMNEDGLLTEKQSLAALEMSSRPVNTMMQKRPCAELVSSGARDALERLFNEIYTPDCKSAQNG